MKRIILIITVICLLILSGCGKDEPVKKDRSPWEVKCGQGSEYMHSGDYEKAVESFTAAIELEPEKIDAYLSRAEAYFALGESEENLLLALADYEKALSMDASDATILGTQINMAHVYIRMGDNEKAFEILQNASASEKTEVTSGTCGADLRWTLENNILTISGSGPMDDYSFHSISTEGEYSYEGAAPWRGLITEVIIEDGVTSIGEYAFDECFSLRKITIPESVTSIGYGAFNLCMSLESIMISPDVTSIGRMAFHKCTALKEVIIPDSVTEIGFDAFSGWTSKQTIFLEGRTSVPEEWGDYWLSECSAQVVCEE